MERAAEGERIYKMITDGIRYKTDIKLCRRCSARLFFIFKVTFVLTPFTLYKKYGKINK